MLVLKEGRVSILIGPVPGHCSSFTYILLCLFQNSIVDEIAKAEERHTGVARKRDLLSIP